VLKEKKAESLACCTTVNFMQSTDPSFVGMTSKSHHYYRHAAKVKEGYASEVRVLALPLLQERAGVRWGFNIYLILFPLI
jgi:hypothetical protein